ncbi:hypothetical protein FOL47_004100 [Perkinsus chesapeaki]|uniref:Uncharacterized protein n=1 Tax=Perkinsus chesapeaki TaxID=330153 RepID=A0A7J6M4G1_PERCH|nr:hypothetical protein FOL47_004100 [Perkinsus chesapeaki]
MFTSQAVSVGLSRDLEVRLIIFMVHVMGEYPDASGDELKDVALKTGHCTGQQADILLEKLPAVMDYLHGGDEVLEYPLELVVPAVCKVYTEEDEIRQEAANKLASERRSGGSGDRLAIRLGPYPMSEYGFDLGQDDPEMAFKPIPEEPQKKIKGRGVGPETGYLAKANMPHNEGDQLAECRHLPASRVDMKPSLETVKAERRAKEGSSKGDGTAVGHHRRTVSNTQYVPMPTSQLKMTAEKLWRSCCCEGSMKAMGLDDFEMSLAVALSKGYKMFRAKKDEPAPEQHSAIQHSLRDGLLLVQTRAKDMWAWGYAINEPDVLKYFPVDGHRVVEINMG